MTPNIDGRRMIPSLLHNPRARVKAVLPLFEPSTAVGPVAVMVLSPYPKPLQVCFCLAQVESTLRARPVVNQFCNGKKPLGVSATLPRSEPATDKQVTVNQLMEERRNEQSSAVL